VIRSSFALAALLATVYLPAQEFRGAIGGNVTDPQLASVANVSIVATEMQTGTKSRARSDASGIYTIPFLTPGNYEISAEAPGFKRFVQEKVALDAGAHLVLDIHLTVGDLKESVNVSAEAPILETANGSVAQAITASQVEDFALNGRTPFMLAQLAVGVVATPSGTGAAGAVHPYDTSGPTAFSAGGAPSGQNELLVDGSPDQSFSLGVAYNPPVDAVLEVHMRGFQSDAAFGHTGGGTANQITKSGTNDVHGSLYEFNQVTALQANAFFVNKAGQPRAIDHYNQYGLTAGGPLVVPKLFNGRNKVFWFFAWEGLKSPNLGPVTTTVPTAAERKGDFSALLAVGSQYQIYDPLSGAVSGSQIARQPFPGNVIPSNRLSPIAQSYLQFYPQPNTVGRNDGLNNYYANPDGKNDFSNEFGRMDFNLSPRQKLFWDIRTTDFSQTDSFYFNNIGIGDILNRVNWGSTLDDVYTFGPTLFADVRLNWSRFVEDYVNPAAGFDPTTLGYPAYLAASAEVLQMPSVSFSGSAFQSLGNRTTWYHMPSDSFQIFGDLVKVHGSHTLKFGVDLREYRMSRFAPGNATGTFSFGTNWTNGPFSNSAAAPIGQEFAAFLLGLPSSGSYDLNTYGQTQSKYFAPFLQDDWRVNSNLSINLGIRFEYETPSNEKYGRTVDGFDTTDASPIAAAATAAYAKNPIPQIPVGQFNVLGGLQFASPQNPAAYQTESHIFSPRVGFAWTPSALHGKTVIRGGMGVFVYPIGINGGLALNQSGFSQTTQMVVTNNNYLSPAGTLANPFPNGFQQPAGSSLGLGTFLGQSVTFFNPHVHNPYSIRWNFGIQRQLSNDMVLEVAYIGNHSVHLPVSSTSLDGIPQADLATGWVRNQQVINSLSSTVANPFAGLLPGSSSLNGSTVALSALLPPFPQFSGVTEQDNGAGSGYYQSLNVRLQKRISHGLSLTSNFVWNSFIERLIYLNAFDPAPEKVASTSSRPLRYIAAATYSLPVGKGRAIDFGSTWKNGLLGGWVVTGIYTWQLGAPLSWGNVIYYGGGIHLDARQVNGPAFDITQFNTVSAQQVANNVRTFQTTFGNLRADGINSLNASLLKEYHFSERRYLQLRLEAFNAFNRPAFAAPNLTPTSSAFGLITATTISPRTVQLGGRLVW
jgi:hypothetical protein